MSKSVLKMREVNLLPGLVAPAGNWVVDQQWAVVVGVGNYGHEFDLLDNSVQDATAVADLLVQDYGFSLFPAGKPLLDADHDLIRDTVEASLKMCTATSRWLFYFAGHGLVIDGQGYLLPADATRADADKYLAIRWLLDGCLDSQSAEALIILDACYGGRALVRAEDLSDLIPEDERAGQVRQLITSGNPNQPVLDGGGSGHSVFTQSLLDVLRGWAGIHEDDGRLRFARLLDHLVFEIPARLRAQGYSAALQQPIGGNLRGNQRQRDFVFRSQVARLSPETVRGACSEVPARRQEHLLHLVAECAEQPALRPLAMKLLQSHLQPRPADKTSMLVAGTLNYEPVPEVRVQAARALGILGDLEAAGSLIAALDDGPAVCRAAALALGQLGDPSAAPALLEKLKSTGDELLLDLVEALGLLGDDEVIIAALRESMSRGRLVPFVGPDLDQNLTGLPDRAAAAHELAERYGLLDGPELDTYSLSAVAKAVMGGMPSRTAFGSFMRERFDSQLLQPGPIHQALARLDLPFWISGTYDDLLPRALGANSIVMGVDTRYWRPDRSTVLRLLGDPNRPESLVVLDTDYASLRKNEGDRRLLVNFLQPELQGKVVLFLGWDPKNPDFTLLVDLVLGKHLMEVDVRCFCVWPAAGLELRWAEWPLHWIGRQSLAFVEQLAAD